MLTSNKDLLSDHQYAYGRQPAERRVSSPHSRTPQATLGALSSADPVAEHPISGKVVRFPRLQLPLRLGCHG